MKLQSQTIEVGEHKIILNVPANPDEVLARAIDERNDSVCEPYWGVLWPAAAKTAAMLLQYAVQDNIQTLEIGCGAGMTGIAALMCGHRVTFSDVVPDAVKLAIANAALNGFSTSEGLVLNWSNPVDRKFDLIIGSDVLYEVSSHTPLMQTLDSMLAQHGEVWLGDTGRGNALSFIDMSRQRGWHVRVFDENNRQLSDANLHQFQLFRLTRQ